MARLSLNRVRAFWRRLTLFDRAALVVVFLYVLARVVVLGFGSVPGSGLLGFLCILAVGYLLVRSLPWVRAHLLWSLRNRLVVAYLFIAVVPVVLLLTMVGLASYLVYFQLGAHLLRDDLQERIELIGTRADEAAINLANGSAKTLPVNEEQLLARPDLGALIAAARKELPGLRFELASSEELLRQLAGIGADHYEGIMESGDKLWLRGVASKQGSAGRVVVVASAPISPELLDSLASELGPIELTLMRPAAPDDRRFILETSAGRFVPAGQVTSRRRVLTPRAGWLDMRVNGGSTLEAVYAGPDGRRVLGAPVLASFSVRPSRLHAHLFKSVGALGDPLVVVLILVGVVFMILEVAALITGVVLTRTITRAVDDLYVATQHIRRGDFTHRVRIQHRDQLGVLAESFNAMTSSVAELIEEQRQRQRLENELTIAREVQSQLFPRELPSIPGIQLAAICRPARVVSGDYYDLIPLGARRLAIAVADISGKGNSAALLMASLQAALRSQALLDGDSSAAELVSRLNQHLFHNTSDDRYATFFYATYDSTTRTLNYVNAGHVAPFYVVGDKIQKLEEGGTVVGLFDECTYKQGTLQVAAGSWLVAYSDGLIEPENVYGEEFGTRRLMDETLRQRDTSPQHLAESLIDAAEQWSGTPEQADDMTVLVARLE